jgi:hypothetical protein
MTVGEYLAVFASIILGLAVGDMALSLHRLISAGRAVRWDWLSPSLALFVLLNLLGTWWASFGWYRSSPNLSVVGFLPDVAIFILVYLSAAAVLPDEVPPEGIDLRTFYFARARYFWIVQLLIVACVILFVGPRYAPEGWRAVVANQTANLLSIPVLLLLAFNRRPWLHRILVPMFLIYAVSNYLDLGMRDIGTRMDAIAAGTRRN